jgi:hypothetical protein
MDNGLHRGPDIAGRMVRRVTSLKSVGLAAALLLALGLGGALLQSLRAEAASAGPPQGSGVRVALQTPTPTLPPTPTLTPTLPPTPTLPVATPTQAGSTGASSECPSLDPSSGCTFFGAPDWLLAALVAAVILLLIIVAVTASGRRR